MTTPQPKLTQNFIYNIYLFILVNLLFIVLYIISEMHVKLPISAKNPTTRGNKCGIEHTF